MDALFFQMFCTIGSSGKTDLNWSTMVLRNTFIHLRANGLPDMLPAQMAILLPGWIKPKKNLALIFKPFNHKVSKALCHSRVPFFYSGKIRRYAV